MRLMMRPSWPNIGEVPSEQSQVIAVPDHLAELLYDPQRVSQQIAVRGRKLSQPNDGFHLTLTRLHGAQLRPQPNLHEEGEGAGELAPKILAEHAVGRERRDAFGRRGDHDPALYR